MSDLIDIYYQEDGQTLLRVSRHGVPRRGEKILIGPNCFVVEHLEWHEPFDGTPSVLIDLVEVR